MDYKKTPVKRRRDEQEKKELDGTQDVIDKAYVEQKKKIDEISKQYSGAEPEPDPKPRGTKTYKRKPRKPTFSLSGFPILILIVAATFLFYPTIIDMMSGGLAAVDDVPAEALPEIEQPYIPYYQKLVLLVKYNKTECPELSVVHRNTTTKVDAVKNITQEVNFVYLGRYDTNDPDNKVNFNFVNQNDCAPEILLITNEEFLTLIMEYGVKVAEELNVQVTETDVKIYNNVIDTMEEREEFQEIMDENQDKQITIENNTFIGDETMIGGGGGATVEFETPEQTSNFFSKDFFQEGWAFIMRHWFTLALMFGVYTVFFRRND